MKTNNIYFTNLIVTIVLLALLLCSCGKTEVLKSERDFQTVSADISQGDLIEFGSYPQIKVNDEEIVAKLNEDEGEFVSYNFVLDGKDTSDFMRYKDVELDGEKYRGVVFDSYRTSDATTQNTDTSAQELNGYEAGKIYWFKFQPIVWRVLDPDDGLCMTNNIIDAGPVAETYFYDGETDQYYTDQTKTHFQNSYEHSDLRTYLNGDFITIAFGDTDNIVESEITNKAGYGGLDWSAYDGEDTKDYVFLPSADEVINYDYGFSVDPSEKDTNRCLKATDYAKCMGVSVYRGDDEAYDGNSPWWVRSAGSNTFRIITVYSNGFLNSGINANYTYYGIAPMIRLASFDGLAKVIG